MVSLPTHETRHQRYVTLLAERFGESPRRVSEGAGLVDLPIALCPDCLLPLALCADTRCRTAI